MVVVDGGVNGSDGGFAPLPRVEHWGEIEKKGRGFLGKWVEI